MYACRDWRLEQVTRECGTPAAKLLQESYFRFPADPYYTQEDNQIVLWLPNSEEGLLLRTILHTSPDYSIVHLHV